MTNEIEDLGRSLYRLAVGINERVSVPTAGIRVQRLTPRKTVKLAMPSIGQLARYPPATRFVFTQVMPIAPTGNTYYTKVGNNPHYSSVYNLYWWRKFTTYEPKEVELIDYELAGNKYSTPVIDVTKRLIYIPHRTRLMSCAKGQLYQVTVQREPGNISATVVLDPVEHRTDGCCCLKTDLESLYEEYLIRYRSSRWTLGADEAAGVALSNVNEIFALGFRTKETKFVALQIAPYVSAVVEYEDFIGLDLRNGTRFSVSSVEHNMHLYKSLDVIRSAPMVAKAIMAHVRITDFPADGSSYMEGGSGEANIYKLDKTVPINDDVPEPPIVAVPPMSDINMGVPVKTKQTVVEAEAERVAPFLNDTKPPEWIEEVKRRFKKLLFPKEYRGTGAPISVEEAIEMERPSQAAKFDRVGNDVLNMTEVLKALEIFLKTEVAEPAAAARIIANFSDAERVFGRVFGHPLSEYLKNKTFLKGHYGFVAPADLERMFEETIAKAKQHMSETDFAKMDATINLWMRNFERELGLEFFNKDYHSLWKIWHSKLYAKSKSKPLKGKSIKLGASRRSGEYYTSIFNTVLAFFYIVCVYVFMHGCSVEEAIAMAGMAGGDDGLHPDLDKVKAEEVARLMGFEVKVKNIERGQPVSLLGYVRFAPEVYMYDPLRFVKKFGTVSTGNTVPVRDALYRKYEPYARYYPDVPLIGSASRSIMRLLRRTGFTKPDPKYDEQCKRSSSYMLALAEESGAMLPCNAPEGELLGMIAARLGEEIVLVEKVCARYDEALSFSHLPNKVFTCGESKECKYPTMFQGNLYKYENLPAAEAPEKVRRVKELKLDTLKQSLTDFAEAQAAFNDTPSSVKEFFLYENPEVMKERKRSYSCSTCSDLYNPTSPSSVPPAALSDALINEWREFGNSSETSSAPTYEDMDIMVGSIRLTPGNTPPCDELQTENLVRFHVEVDDVVFPNQQNGKEKTKPRRKRTRKQKIQSGGSSTSANADGSSTSQDAAQKPSKRKKISGQA